MILENYNLKKIHFYHYREWGLVSQGLASYMLSVLIMGNMTSSTKSEIHNILQRRKRGRGHSYGHMQHAQRILATTLEESEKEV